jgi:hypothetical protein
LHRRSLSLTLGTGGQDDRRSPLSDDGGLGDWLGAQLEKHSKLDLVPLLLAVTTMSTARYWSRSLDLSSRRSGSGRSGSRAVTDHRPCSRRSTTSHNGPVRG